MSLHQVLLYKFSSGNYCASIFFGSLQHSTWTGGGGVAEAKKREKEERGSSPSRQIDKK